MNRRDWLKGGAAMAAAAGMANGTPAMAQGSKPRSYFLTRIYKMQSGPNGKLLSTYLSDALLPALQRLGLGPVGVFNLSYGDATPQVYVLISSSDLEKLAHLDHLLAKDAAFVTAAAPFWAAPATTPPFISVSSRLSIAFEGFPQLVVPAKEPRILQLRTYISPTFAAHERKVEMFHQGEFRIFEESGTHGVFYADNLIGADLPSLSYMLVHKDMTAMEESWKKFFSHPDWKKLSANPRYAADPIVNHVDNLILTPTAYSQI